MPCGGIYPVKGSWVEPYFLTDISGTMDERHSGPPMCYGCGEPILSIEEAAFCDEWDCNLHISCIDAFLKTDEGRVIIDHHHEVIKEWPKA